MIKIDNYCSNTNLSAFKGKKVVTASKLKRRELLTCGVENALNTVKSELSEQGKNIMSSLSAIAKDFMAENPNLSVSFPSVPTVLIPKKNPEFRLHQNQDGDEFLSVKKGEEFIPVSKDQINSDKLGLRKSMLNLVSKYGREVPYELNTMEKRCNWQNLNILNALLEDISLMSKEESLDILKHIYRIASWELDNVPGNEWSVELDGYSKHYNEDGALMHYRHPELGNIFIHLDYKTKFMTIDIKKENEPPLKMTTFYTNKDQFMH